MHTRFLVGSLLALTLLLTNGAGNNSTSAAAPTDADAIDRDWEPVVVQGVFPGAPVGQLFVYRYASGAWEQIVSQVDERTANDAYVANENGTMDANDEVVFMASDLGELAPETAAPTATLQISDTWYVVEVTDPLPPSEKGWAYIVRSTTLTPNGSLPDNATYAAGTRQITARDYAIGYADSHNGLDYMSFFGGSDILDRTKLRIVAGFVQLTEDSPLFAVQPVELIKDGKVRVITKRSLAVTLAYASLIQTTTSFPVPQGVAVNQVRISTDLVSGTTGTYFNPNTAGPVTIDGELDPNVATPFIQPWRQVGVSSGVIVQVIDFGGIEGTPTHYYNDDSSFTVPPDTGESGAWGDSGFSLSNVQPVGDQVGYTSYQYILPAPTTNRGAEIYDKNQEPLEVEVSLEGGEQHYLFIPVAFNLASAR